LYWLFKLKTTVSASPNIPKEIKNIIIGAALLLIAPGVYAQQSERIGNYAEHYYDQTERVGVYGENYYVERFTGSNGYLTVSEQNRIMIETVVRRKYDDYLGGLTPKDRNRVLESGEIDKKIKLEVARRMREEYL
jgi:hypothetical protein